MAKAKSAEMKIRKKRWVELVSPLFGDRIIGETCVYDLHEALGRIVSINLMNLTGDPRKQNIDLVFKVEKQKGETAVIANAYGFKMQQPALRKLVRRGKSKIQDSFKCYTGDKKPIVIKTFILARSMINRSLSSKIMKTVRQITVNEVAKMTFDDYIGSVIENRFQAEMKSIVSKIYPIRILEYYTIETVVPGRGKFEVPKALDELVSETKEAKEEEEPQQAEAAEQKAEPQAEEQAEESEGSDEPDVEQV